jgi:hypothetical protein
MLVTTVPEDGGDNEIKRQSAVTMFFDRYVDTGDIYWPGYLPKCYNPGRQFGIGV